MAAARKTGSGKTGKGQRKPSAAEVAEAELFERLKQLLTAVGCEITVSKTIEGRGGDCVLRGTGRVIVSRRLAVADRVEVLLDALARLDLSSAEVSPDIDNLVASRRRAASRQDAVAG